MPRKDAQNETDDDDLRVGRRGFIALTGAALATGAGFVSQSTEMTVPAQVKPLELYGYGGTPIRTTESISTSSTLTTTATKLVATTETEPNDVRANASNVGTGAEVTATLDQAEVDWYAFDLSKGEEVHVTLDRETTTGITAVILYGPAGDYVDLIYAGTGKAVTVDIKGAKSSGTHYAEIVDIQDGDGPYTLRIESGTTDSTTDSTTDGSTTDDTTVVEDTTIEFGTQGYGELGYGGVSA